VLGRLRRRAPQPPADPFDIVPGLSWSCRRAIAGGRAVVGRGSYIGAEVAVYDRSTNLQVGNYSSIGEDVRILLGGEHRPDWVSTYPFRIMGQLPGRGEDGHPLSRGDVLIGHDVWVGRSALILSGVRIGDGAVVAAGAVVVRDVEPYSIVAGNPARELRKRFDDDVIEGLLRLRWWDWPEAQVWANIEGLCSPDVRAFLKHHAAATA
jgi:acetyltransferase-like isoleucine patch superfamily enzyme